MSKLPISEFDKAKVVAENRRARFDYFVEERFEAGIELQGTKVKALRTGEGSITCLRKPWKVPGPELPASTEVVTAPLRVSR